MATGDPGHAITTYPDPLKADPIEQELGKGRSEFVVQDLLEYCRRRELRLVSLLHIAGDGTLKRLDFAARDTAHLERILRFGERADGSSLFKGDLEAGKSDVRLLPRPTTAFLDPFTERPTLDLFCAHCAAEGPLLPCSPDTILCHAAERLGAEHDLELHALGEVEYFVRRPEGSPTPQALTERGYHSTAPLIAWENLRLEALQLLCTMGVPVKYAHAEVSVVPDDKGDSAWEQHEVELDLLPARDAANAVVLTCWVLSMLAQRKGAKISFKPVVAPGHAGSGMHFHLALSRKGKLLPVLDAKGRLTDSSIGVIAGLVANGSALMVFGNRDATSIDRLIAGKEAPNTITWGQMNRHALVRLPLVGKSDAGELMNIPTIEFRLPDGSAHPHFLLAGICQATRWGLAAKNAGELLKSTAVDQQHDRAPSEAASLPLTRKKIAEALESRRAVFEQDGVFPKRLLDRLIDEFQVRLAESHREGLPLFSRHWEE